VTSRTRTTPRAVAAAALGGVGCVLGWPAVGALAALSIRLDAPLLAAVGTPACLVLSHLLFAAGLYVAGGARAGSLLERLRGRRGSAGEPR
jgi:hypothetical protein